MPSTITLKMLTDDIYERLKQSAEAHRCGLDCQAIVCLETVVPPAWPSPCQLRRLSCGKTTPNAGETVTVSRSI